MEWEEEAEAVVSDPADSNAAATIPPTAVVAVSDKVVQDLEISDGGSRYNSRS